MVLYVCCVCFFRPQGEKSTHKGWKPVACLRPMIIKAPTKKPPPRIGTKDCFVVPPNFRLEIGNWKLEIGVMPICNLQSAICNPLRGRYRGQPRFHTCPLALRKRLRGGVAWLMAKHARSRWRALPDGCRRATCPRQRSICICSSNHSTGNRSRQVGNWMYSWAVLARLTALFGGRTLPIKSHSGDDVGYMVH